MRHDSNAFGVTLNVENFLHCEMRASFSKSVFNRVNGKHWIVIFRDQDQNLDAGQHLISLTF